MMTGMSDIDRRSRLTLAALIGGVVLVVVIALIAVFARGGAAPLDPATPEGVVQRYSQAVVDGDTQTALTYVVPEVADACVRDMSVTKTRGSPCWRPRSVARPRTCACSS